jgi:hypothetical protein
MRASTSLLISDSKPGFIQFFDPKAGKHVSELEVHPQNLISSREDEKCSF